MDKEISFEVVGCTKGERAMHCRATMASQMIISDMSATE